MASPPRAVTTLPYVVSPVRRPRHAALQANVGTGRARAATEPCMLVVARRLVHKTYLDTSSKLQG